MIISNDTFAVHFVEAEVRGDGEEGEEAQHEAHGGGGQQGGGGRGRGRGDGAAHRSWTSLNAHCCVFPIRNCKTLILLGLPWNQMKNYLIK